jgi:hypothetical protein
MNALIGFTVGPRFLQFPIELMSGSSALSQQLAIVNVSMANT